MSEDRRISYEKRDHIVTITINRPDKLNAMDPPANQQLTEAWITFKDDPDAWVAILTGTGEKAFSAGADLASASEGFESGSRGWRSGTSMDGICKNLRIFKPLIAAINGLAYGQGLEMALACDMRIAAENAKLGLPEVRWSLIAAGGGPARLTRAMPLAKAMEMIITGEPITAQEALHYGLVNSVVPQAEVLPTALKLAERICENGPLGVWASKEAALRGLDTTLEDAMFLDDYLLAKLVATEDAKEGPRAFLEKRKPQFKVR